MLRARALLAIGLMATVGACSIGAPTFTAVFPARGEPGGITTGAEPVSLSDTTGLVEGIAVVDGWPANPGAEAVPGRPDVLRVSWTGGACEARVHLVLTSSPQRYKVTVDSDPSLGGMLGCPAVGIPRTIDIDFSEPIEPSRLLVENLF